jgi:nucleotide-binding universal stress UspA family protein
MIVAEHTPLLNGAAPVTGDLRQAVGENSLMVGPVLVALHGSESSHAAIDAARALAARLGVDLRVVTVVEPEAVYGAGLDVWPLMPVPLDLGFGEAQAASVRRVLRAAIGSDDGWQLDVRHGRPAREICRMAEEIDASVIVMDAAPHRGLRHEVAGVRVLQVLRHARCPVLSVAPNFTRLPVKALAAIDFSPASIRAAQAALLMIPEGGALELLHVVLPVHFDQPFEDRSGALIGGDVGDELQRVRAELLRHAPPNVTITTQVRSGAVGSEVLRTAEALHADLIAVGAHGRGVVERLFVGSVASHVVHLAPVSVLAAPNPRPAEFMRLKLRMTDTVVSEDRTTWREVLDAFSTRNAGRRVTMEVDDPAIGAQMQTAGYVFRGMAYDPDGHRVDIMLGSPSGEGHLTRTIPAVKSIAVTASPAGRDMAVEVAHGHGHTLVMFEEPPKEER